MQTQLATAAAHVNPICLKCGAIEKTGKLSCCARGGSWYGKCGSILSAKLLHTWSEGIEACEAAVGQPELIVEQKVNRSPNDGRMIISPKAAITTAHVPASTPTNIQMSAINSVTMYSNTSMKALSITSMKALGITSRKPLSIASKRVSMDTSMLAAVPNRMSTVHNNITTTFESTTETITSATIALVDTFLNMSMTMPPISPAKIAILSQNQSSRSKADQVVTVTDVMSHHASDSKSIILRECEHILDIVGFIHLIALIVTPFF